jgi:L-lactate dehydrogenase complex protein LldG
MTEKTAAVGTIVHHISSIPEAIEYAINLTKRENLKTLACPDLEKKDRDMTKNLARSENLKLLESPLRDHAHCIDTCLTRVNYGIADTGTLVLISDQESIRIATMLSKIHIAVLPISKIKKDTTAVESYLDQILKKDAPSYTAFITGASRTADIERVLAIGVHGPVALHLLLMKED